MVIATMVAGASTVGMIRAIIGALAASTRFEAAHHRVATALRFWNQANTRKTPLTAATKLPATINVGRSIDMARVPVPPDDPSSPSGTVEIGTLRPVKRPLTR